MLSFAVFLDNALSVLLSLVYSSLFCRTLQDRAGT